MATCVIAVDRFLAHGLDHNVAADVCLTPGLSAHSHSNYTRMHSRHTFITKQKKVCTLHPQ